MLEEKLQFCVNCEFKGDYLFGTFLAKDIRTIIKIRKLFYQIYSSVLLKANKGILKNINLVKRI